MTRRRCNASIGIARQHRDTIANGRWTGNQVTWRIGTAGKGPRETVATAVGDAYIGEMSAPSPKLCVICGKPQAEGLAPFCSRRCADVDLNRWLTGVYAVPGAEEEEGDPDRPRKPDDEA
jgi:uncharacterized protein